MRGRKGESERLPGRSRSVERLVIDELMKERAAIADEKRWFGAGGMRRGYETEEEEEGGSLSVCLCKNYY